MKLNEGITQGHFIKLKTPLFSLLQLSGVLGSGWHLVRITQAQLEEYKACLCSWHSTSIDPLKEKEGYMLPFANAAPIEMAASGHCPRLCSHKRKTKGESE